MTRNVIRAFGGDEVLAAAYWRHESGDFDPPPDEVVRAEKALTDLYRRTDPVRPLSRDDSRLRQRYAATIDAHKADQVARWRAAVDAEDRRLAGSTAEARGILKSLTPKEHTL